MSVNDIENSGKNAKKRNFRKNIQNYFTEYTENTGIHGMKYIGEQNRTITEKIFWLISLSIALYFCISLIIRTYHKWETSPVIVSFATKETPIWQIPFPAVTICPETKILPTILHNTIKDNTRKSTETEKNLAYISFLCPGYKSNFDQKINANDLFNFFENVAPKFYENIFDCFYMGDKYECSDFFTPIITDEGLCYSFNLLNRDDILRDTVIHYKNFHSIFKNKTEWSLEYGYEKSADKNTYPKRALHAGALFDFELKLKTFDEELDFTCGNSIQGYKIQIHHPAMLPRVKQQHFRIPLNQALIAAIMPTMMTTSEAIKSYQPDRRQCFFPSERSLKYFKIYTQQNCQIECKTNYTLKMCGCVDFYMPRVEKTQICGPSLKACMVEAEDVLLSEGINSNIRHHKGLPPEKTKFYEIIENCNCMPECTSMTYIVENSQSEWDWMRKYGYETNSSKINNKKIHMSYLQVFFKGNQFITSERNELYGPTDFLANFGGLLGLFTGFTMLSLIEIFYYVTLRIFCNIRLYGRRFWSGKCE